MDLSGYDAMWYQSELSKALAVIDALEAENARLRADLAAERETTEQLGDRVEMGIEHLQKACRRLRDLAESRRKDNDKLRADLAAALAAAQWTPVVQGTYNMGSGEVEVMEDNTLGIMGADEVGEDACATLAIGDAHAFCARNPAAKVWRPVVGVNVRCACGSPDCKQSIYQSLFLDSHLALRVGQISSDGYIHLPPGKALCELVGPNTAGEGDV